VPDDEAALAVDDWRPAVDGESGELVLLAMDVDESAELEPAVEDALEALLLDDEGSGAVEDTPDDDAPDEEADGKADELESADEETAPTAVDEDA
jgi:hypothetical protein